MPTFTTGREATKDEMGREIDRCHKVIAELEAALAARVCVPDREKVARVIWAAFGHGGPPLEARGVPYGTWAMALAAADAAIAAMQETRNGNG